MIKDTHQPITEQTIGRVTINEDGIAVKPRFFGNKIRFIPWETILRIESDNNKSMLIRFQTEKGTYASIRLGYYEKYLPASDGWNEILTRTFEKKVFSQAGVSTNRNSNGIIG